MKLQTYFAQQKNSYLPEEKKLELYHQILHKQMKTSFQKKRSMLHIKAVIYSCFVFFVVMGMYGTYLLQQPTTTEIDGVGFTQETRLPGAQADYIAKVVDFKGSFYVENAGKIIQTSMIADGDRVVLKEGAQMSFDINQTTKAKITGPAKFLINKKSQNQYTLQLIYGEYIEIATDKKSPQRVQLRTDGVVVTQKGKNMDFQFIKQGKNNIIKNQGGDLLIVKDNQKGTTIKSKQVLAMQGNDISLFDSFDSFTKAVKNKDLSQVFVLHQQSSQTGEITSGAEITKENVLDTAALMNISEQNESEVLVDIPDEKLADNQVATPEQLESLQDFSKDTVAFTMEKIEKANESGDSRAASTALQVLQDKLSYLSKKFSITLSFKGEIFNEQVASTVQNTQILLQKISTSYYLPPKYLVGLQTCKEQLSLLKK